MESSRTHIPVTSVPPAAKKRRASPDRTGLGQGTQLDVAKHHRGGHGAGDSASDTEDGRVSGAEGTGSSASETDTDTETDTDGASDDQHGDGVSDDQHGVSDDNVSDDVGRRGNRVIDVHGPTDDSHDTVSPRTPISRPTSVDDDADDYDIYGSGGMSACTLAHAVAMSAVGVAVALLVHRQQYLAALAVGVGTAAVSAMNVGRCPVLSVLAGNWRKARVHAHKTALAYHSG